MLKKIGRVLVILFAGSSMTAFGLFWFASLSALDDMSFWAWLPRHLLCVAGFAVCALIWWVLDVNVPELFGEEEEDEEF